MRYLRFAALLGICLFCASFASAQRVIVGVGMGPAYVGPAPVCAYGYYDYYPYACAPYGYYSPEWFVGGVFIGAGPWYHGFYGRPGFYGRGYYGRGYYEGRDFGRRGWDHDGFRERGFGHERFGHGGGFHGGGGFPGPGAGFRSGGFHGDRGFHGGGHGGEFHGGGHGRQCGDPINEPGSPPDSLRQ